MDIKDRASGLFGFLRQKNQERKQAEIDRIALEQQIRDAEKHNKGVDSRDNARKQAQFLEAIMGQVGTYQQQAPYLEEYFNLLSNEFPSRGRRIQELGKFGGLSGGNEMNQMLGLEDPQTSALNQLNMGRFFEEFGQPTGNEEIDLRNAELIAKVLEEPGLARQYYGKQYNPNIIDQVGGRIESLLPGPKNTYEEIMRRKRLSEMGLPYESMSTPGYNM